MHNENVILNLKTEFRATPQTQSLTLEDKPTEKYGALLLERSIRVGRRVLGKFNLICFKA